MKREQKLDELWLLVGYSTDVPMKKKQENYLLFHAIVFLHVFLLLIDM